MSRRKNRSAARTDAKTSARDYPAAQADHPRPNPHRPNKPLLIATAVLQAGWIGFLAVIAWWSWR